MLQFGIFYSCPRAVSLLLPQTSPLKKFLTQAIFFQWCSTFAAHNNGKIAVLLVKIIDAVEKQSHQKAIVAKQKITLQ